MPRYDFRCGSGHVSELRASFDMEEVPCPECHQPARRSAVNRIGVAGLSIPPMRERGLPTTRALDALGELQAKARKAGLEPPDVLKNAKHQADYITKHAPELIKGT